MGGGQPAVEGAPRRNAEEEAEQAAAARSSFRVAALRLSGGGARRHARGAGSGGAREACMAGGGEVTMVQLRPSPCSQSLSSHAPLPRLSCSAARRGRRLGRRACSRGTGVHRTSPFHPPGDPVVIARLVPNFRRFSPSSLTSMTFGGQCRREIEREDRER